MDRRGEDDNGKDRGEAPRDGGAASGAGMGEKRKGAGMNGRGDAEMPGADDAAPLRGSDLAGSGERGPVLSGEDDQETVHADRAASGTGAPPPEVDLARLARAAARGAGLSGGDNPEISADDNGAPSHAAPLRGSDGTASRERGAGVIGRHDPETANARPAITPDDAPLRGSDLARPAVLGKRGADLAAPSETSPPPASELEGSVARGSGVSSRHDPETTRAAQAVPADGALPPEVDLAGLAGGAARGAGLSGENKPTISGADHAAPSHAAPPGSDLAGLSASGAGPADAAPRAGAPRGEVVAFGTARGPDPDAICALMRDYWDGLRQSRDVPARAEITPAGLGRAVDHAFILERIAPGAGRFRLAGSRLIDLMGMEVRGMPVCSVMNPSSRGRLSDVLETVFKAPQIAEFWLHAPGAFGRPELTGRMVLLPLRSDLGDVTRALGALCVAGDPGRGPRRFDIIRDAVFPLLRGGATLTPSPSAPPARERGFAEPQTPYRAPLLNRAAHTTPEQRRAAFRVVGNDE